MSDILTGTPPDLTYAHDLVRQAWMVVWAITSGALVVILGWMGLSLIMAEHLGRQQAGWREMVPRLVLGLVAAASSLWWCALVLDVADAVSGFIAVSLNVTPGDLLRAPLDTLLTAVQAGSVGMAQLLALLYLVYGFFVLYVIVQMVLRLALIDILLALAPIALGAVDSAPHGGLGPPLAAALHDDGVPAGGPAHRPGPGLRLPQRVRGHRRLRAGAGPDLEAADVPGLRLHGDPVPSMLGNARDLRLLALDALLRHEPARSMVRSARTIGLVAGARREGREAWRWERWRPARACRPPPAASARRPRWRPHRPAETAAERPQEQRRVATTTTHRRGRQTFASNTTQEGWSDVQSNGAEADPDQIERRAEGRKQRGEKRMEQLTQTISNLVGILLGVVGAVGVGFFIYGAYLYLTASGAPHQMERGKSAMMTALAGIVLALVAYGVVELVMNAVVDPGRHRRRAARTGSPGRRRQPATAARRT